MEWEKIKEKKDVRNNDTSLNKSLCTIEKLKRIIKIVGQRKGKLGT